MTTGANRRPVYSMTLITEMMERPLDPGYAAAAERRQRAGLPAAVGVRSPLLVIVAVLIGALLGASALALRAPATATTKVKRDLVGRIEDRRTHVDAQTRLIAALRNEINVSQAAALSARSESGLAARLSTLELAAGTVPVAGPGLVLTVDDAPAKAEPGAPDANPRTAVGSDQGKVSATDLQLIVNGLWDASAEAVSVNGHRLTSLAAIRSAGAAILVHNRPLTRPYVISAIGDPASLGVEFADNSGGSYLQALTNNFQIRGDIQSRTSVAIPGEPTLSLSKASVTRTTPRTNVPQTAAPRTTAPRTTETSP